MTDRSEFVGRGKELAELRVCMTQARRGNGAVALIRGELGIGKTRLMEEFSDSVRGQDATVVGGRWYESREAPVYVGFRESLLLLLQRDSVLGALDRSSPLLPELARLGPEFSAVLNLKPTASIDVGGGEQYRLWGGMAIVLRAAAAIAPLIVLLDDLQWADPGSLGFLSFLGREVIKSRLLVVGTYRDEDVLSGHPLHDTIADLTLARALKTIRLTRLSKQDVGALAVGIAHTNIASEFIDALQEQAQGNPLFVEELLRHFLDRASATDDATIPPSDIEVPDGLQQVIGGRISRLSSDCRRLLEIVAVIGRESALSLILRISESTRESLLCSLDEAVNAAVIREVAPGVVAFRHPLMRTVVYRGMPPSERLTTHLRVAGALQGERDGAGSAALETCRHLIAAGDLADPALVGECLKGARQARLLFDFGEARLLLLEGLRALEGLPEPDPTLRAQILTELGYAENGIARPDDAIRRYREALATYISIGDVGGATDVRRWLAGTLIQHGRTQEALGVTREGVAASPEERLARYHGLVEAHAVALIMTGSVAEAGPWVEKGLELAYDDITTANATHIAAIWHSWGAGDRGEAGRSFRKARELLLAGGWDSTAAGIACDHAVTAYFLGDTTDSEEAARQAERLAAATGRAATLVDLRAIRTLVHLHRGEWAEAEHLMDGWRTAAAALGSSGLYGQVARRGEALYQFWQRGPAGVPALLDLSFPLNPPLLAFVSAEAADTEGALRMLGMLAARVPSRGRGLLWLSAGLPLVSALCTLGNESAIEWYEPLTEYRGCVTDWFLVDLELARIGALAGRWDQALEHFDDAVRFCEQRSLRPFLGQVHYRRALMLLARRGAGDRRQAHSLLEQAHDLFSGLGMDFMREKVSAVLGEKQKGRPLSTGVAGLTPRELMVLRLLAQGSSNREIAGELFVSEKTVEHHLASVYGKLNVPSRAAATAFAHREGLV